MAVTGPVNSRKLAIPLPLIALAFFPVRGMLLRLAAELKTRIDGDTVTLKPGTLALA